MPKSLQLFYISCIFCACTTAQIKNADIPKTVQKKVTRLNHIPTREDSVKYNKYKGKLKGKPITVEVFYGAIACECAQWTEGNQASDTNGEREYFYLEPADSTLTNADTLFNGMNLPIRIAVTGQFYQRDGYPKDYFPAKGSPDPARVFRYRGIKIIETGKAN